METLRKWQRPNGTVYYALEPENPNDIRVGGELDEATVRPSCASCDNKKKLWIVGAVLLGYYLLSRGR